MITFSATNIATNATNATTTTATTVANFYTADATIATVTTVTTATTATTTTTATTGEQMCDAGGTCNVNHCADFAFPLRLISLPCLYSY